jgi:hypothetical protein
MYDSYSSAISEGARVARDRLAPKTQEDYASVISQLAQVAFEDKVQFSDCISGDEILLPVRLPLGKAYLAQLRDRRVPWPLDPRQGDERTGVKHLSSATIDQAAQAIKYTFSKEGIPMPAADTKFYNDFPHAYKHILAQAKAEGAFPASGGAVPLTMLATIRLLEAAMKYVPTGKGAAEACVQQLWLFILLAIATCGSCFWFRV